MQAILTQTDEPAAQDVAVTREPRHVCLPKKSISQAPTGAELTTRMQDTASRMAMPVASTKRLPRPTRQIEPQLPSKPWLEPLVAKFASATKRGVRRVIERSPQVFD